jgi:hypothetical protein
MILAVLGVLIGVLWALAARALGLPWWAAAVGIPIALGGILSGALCTAAARADEEMGAK